MRSIDPAPFLTLTNAFVLDGWLDFAALAVDVSIADFGLED
jgi:hypothetical protein